VSVEKKRNSGEVALQKEVNQDLSEQVGTWIDSLRYLSRRVVTEVLLGAIKILVA
jgi:hypothetical protein